MPTPARLLRTVARGALGGVVATVGMTMYRIPVFKGLPPTAEFWARYVGGGDAEQYPLQGLVLHVLYGTVAGGAFGTLASFLDVPDPERRELAGLLGGLVYGVVLSVVGSRVIFVHVLGRKLRSEDALVFHVGHVIYGLTLGTFVAMGERVGEVYRESEPTRLDSETEPATP